MRILLCLLLLVLHTEAMANTPSPSKTIYLLTYEGIINPVASELFVGAISRANAEGAEALVIQLDTPGGLDTAMRDIIKAMIASNVPVIVHVSPSGGRAASAGAFIALASHVAAMTPGTNIGAAHPVSIGGAKMDDDTRKKVENDAAAYIRTLAEQRGRNPQWAEDAVRKSVSATEKEALDLKIIDVIANDLTDLLQKINGKEVPLPQKTVVLSTVGASVITLTIGLRHKILKMISDPNVAYILMLVGTTGLIAELYSPGLIFPGVAGAISLILAFYAFQTLPVNYVGVALIFLSVILFVSEIIVPGFGLLAVGGVTALLIGSLMLFDTGIPALQVSIPVLLTTVLTVGLLSAILVRIAWRAQRGGRRVVDAGGDGAVVGQVGVVKSDLNPTGSIWVHGELWQAEAEETILAGEKAEVTQRTGLLLRVKKNNNGDNR